MKFVFLTFIASKLVFAGLAQAQIIPGEFASVLIQLPLVGLFAWYVLHSNKQNREWLDHLLETQDTRHTRTIALFEKIFERMDTRQGQMADKVEDNTRQLAINTSTVNESMRLGELAEELKKLVNDK
ncbi:MAG: hypothetical protein KAR42_17885 [candidate division Zixibacteria bacterium]|nr:hypothetical protein [candidate division Zixibacteria bacterium]